MPRLVVVIVTWNGRQHLERCLPALRTQTWRDFSIFLVDNGSSDGTVDFVRREHPEVVLIPLATNRGFAEPNNIAMRQAMHDPAVRYLVTLNNDTQPDSGYLEELVACAERHPDAGAIQPKVVNFFEPGVIDSAGMVIGRDMSATNRGLKEVDRGQYEQEEEIFGAAASAALYRRTALEAVALFDGDGVPQYFDREYFAYHEDVDLAWRLRLAGYRAYYAPRARVFHVHSATGGQASPFKAFHVHRNHYCNMIKNLPLRFLLAALGRMPAVYGRALVGVARGRGAAAGVAQGARRGGDGIARLVLRGWWQVLERLPRLLRLRRQIQGRRTVGGAAISTWFRRFGSGGES